METKKDEKVLDVTKADVIKEENKETTEVVKDLITVLNEDLKLVDERIDSIKQLRKFYKKNSMPDGVIARYVDDLAILRPDGTGEVVEWQLARFVRALAKMKDKKSIDYVAVSKRIEFLTPLRKDYRSSGISPMVQLGGFMNDLVIIVNPKLQSGCFSLLEKLYLECKKELLVKIEIQKTL